MHDIHEKKALSWLKMLIYQRSNLNEIESIFLVKIVVDSARCAAVAAQMVQKCCSAYYI